MQIYVGNEKNENYYLVGFGKWIKLPFKLKKEDFSANDAALSWGFSAWEDRFFWHFLFYWKTCKYGKIIRKPFLFIKKEQQNDN